MKDPYTYIEITDYSDNFSTNIREYNMKINDTYTIFETVDVTDPYSFSQDISMISYEDSFKYSYVFNKIYYNGQSWEQTVFFNGAQFYDYSYDDMDTVHTEEERCPDND